MFFTWAVKSIDIGKTHSGETSKTNVTNSPLLFEVTEYVYAKETLSALRTAQLTVFETRFFSFLQMEKKKQMYIKSLFTSG